MLKGIYLSLAATIWLFAATTTDAQEFQLTGISIDPFEQKFFCEAIGGEGVVPTVTVRHSRIGGQRIRLSMRDNTSRGVIDHWSTTVRSDPSGRTIVNFAFRPPCNRTNGRVTSAYSVYAVAENSQVSVLWGRYP